MPAPADREQARIGLERWRDAVARTGDKGLEALAATILRDADRRRLLEALFGNSPFLTAAAERDPGFTVALLVEGPDEARGRIMADVSGVRDRCFAREDPSRPLRLAKGRVALATAVADIAGMWPLETVTAVLSDFAEAALRCAAVYLLLDAAERGVLSLPHPEDPERDSGLIVLGMGKLGSRELNYSSDIDLIVFFDAQRIVTAEPDALQHHFVRITRDLVRIINQRTSDGYVFRTDLRLRPDPGATPLAISVRAAETYYETLGQNWERAAFIKARPVAGDDQAARDFLQHLTPYVWRKHLDFAAIQDIHSIKRQIISHRGGGRIAVAGHNIKLGRGGIREIEFFAQTQQLIWGGRVPEVRAGATADALIALAAGGKIASETAERLIADYRFLRRVEHRLQMINDEQTHTLPHSEHGRTHLATFLGYPSRNAFESALLDHLRDVETHYAGLFEDAPALSSDSGVGGNLVFTGGESDPETLATLERLGFRHPETVDAAVRGWHHGRCRAMRSARAREVLTELMPLLLKSLAGTPDPDAAFLAFDTFLSGLPAGVQLFSMFHSHPKLLELVAEIMGGAPRLARHLTRSPSILEGVLAGDFFEPPPAPAHLARELNASLAQARDFEDVLDRSRRWAKDRRFQVGVQSLRRLLDTEAAAAALSNVAEVAVRALHPRVKADFARQHGRVEGCDMAIIALGKLGGREMTPTSDLDLIFVYATPPPDAISDGVRPLAASQYFARLSQRLINAITAPTAEGVLFEVDMRLRPSGKAGPIAVSFESFRRYQREQAWTWERMALTRTRVIAGPPALAGAIEGVIREVLTDAPAPPTLLADVAEMRARIDAEHHTESLWEVKYLRGGLVDVEFIAQYLQLLHAPSHPQVLSPSTRAALRALREAGLLEPSVADDLVAALRLWQAIQHRVRLTLSGTITALGADDAPEVLRRALDGVEGLAFADLANRARATADRVHRHFVDLIEGPAAERHGAEVLSADDRR